MKKPICTECGACCIPPDEQDYFCDLTKEEYLRFSPQFRTANVKEYSGFTRFAHAITCVPPAALRTRSKLMKSGPFKGYEMCVCAMLDGSVMKRVKCRIYATRPEVCRKAVKPGDKVCRKIRQVMGQDIMGLTKNEDLTRSASESF